jgi:hypothetical protein
VTTERTQAKISIRGIVVTPIGGTPSLHVEIAIDCAECGITEGVITGHHLRTVVQGLQEIMVMHPELCGTLGKVTDRVQFGGHVIPGSEELN